VASPNGAYARDLNQLLPSAPYGIGREVLSPVQVETQMLSAGAGTVRTAILVQPGTDVMHAITVVNRNGVVYFIDTQRNAIVTLPPGLQLYLSN
jgi:hypothetical protein